MKYDYYECGICSHLHPWTFNGDCRDDASRFRSDQVPETAAIADWAERVQADREHNAAVVLGRDVDTQPDAGA